MRERSISAATHRWDALNAAATLVLVVAGALVGIAHGTARYAWLAVAVVLTALQLVAHARVRATQRRATRTAEQLAEDIRTSTNYAISDAFIPILPPAVAMVGPAGRARRRTALTVRRRHRVRRDLEPQRDKSVLLVLARMLAVSQISAGS